MAEKFDIAVIGAGQGGLPAAHMAANLGAKVALIEMREVGGTWVNEGCIPTKTLLRSAEVMHLVHERAHEFGVRGIEPSALSFDLAAAVAGKDAIVKGVIDGIYVALRRNKNITFYPGKAEFTSPVEIRVNEVVIQTDKTILAVGAQPAPAEIPGLENAGYITNYEALSLEKLPASLIVIGAGYVGVEFAQMYSRFSTKVTLIGRGRSAPLTFQLLEHLQYSKKGPI